MNALNSKVMDRRGFFGLAATAGAAAVAGTLLASCSTEGAQPRSEEAQSQAEPTADAATEQAPAAASGDKALVAVFSWSGNTLQMAEYIQVQTGADFFRIEPAEPYTTDYNAVLDVAQQERDQDIRPALAATVENWDEYGTVYLGYPVWWYRAPQVIKSFMDAHDLTGKVVVPFATSGGTSITGTLDDIRALCPGAQLTEGLTLDGGSVASQLDRVDTWLSGLGLL